MKQLVAHRSGPPAVARFGRADVPASAVVSGSYPTVRPAGSLSVVSTPPCPTATTGENRLRTATGIDLFARMHHRWPDGSPPR
jgi:hypothetical protein